MLTIIEDESSNYQTRTEVNAREADVTLAIALYPNSLGEILTKNMVKKHKKIFISVSPHDNIAIKAQEIVDDLFKIFLSTPIKINIAGNGLKTMKGQLNQKECDDFTLKLLTAIVEKDRIKIESIRSGGQTGFDEAGIKASLSLGYNTIAYYPKGFKIVDMSGTKFQKRIDVEKKYHMFVKK
jgi:hypothetical protein